LSEPGKQNIIVTCWEVTLGGFSLEINNFLHKRVLDREGWIKYINLPTFFGQAKNHQMNWVLKWTEANAICEARVKMSVQ
jgi:hypothetical protein